MARFYVARLIPCFQCHGIADIEMPQDFDDSMQSPQLEQEPREDIIICKRIRGTSVVVAIAVLCGMIVLIPTCIGTPSGSDASLPIRRLEEEYEGFTTIQILSPLLVLSTATVVTVLGLLGADSDLEKVRKPHMLLHVVKYAIVDSVDQLVSFYLVIWAFEAGVGDGCKTLAMLALIIGIFAFFGHTASLQQLLQENSKAAAVTNTAGLFADLLSVGAMAAIEMTATENDLLPGWLKGLDWLWSVMGIIGEMYAIMSAVKARN